MISEKRNKSMSKIMIILFFIFACMVVNKVHLLAAQKDEAKYATDSQAFNMKGGDPATYIGSAANISPQTVFEGLIHLTPDHGPAPAIAKSWEIAPGWAYIDFFLRDDVKFHNGEVVTAEDVKFSLDILTRKRNVFRNDYKKLFRDVEAVSPSHIRLHLNNPDWGLFERLWFCGPIMPKAYREQVGDDGFADKPVGAGPFRWLDYKQDQWIKLEAVENHYRKTPQIKNFTVHYVMDGSTRLAMLKAGEVDIAKLAAPNVPLVQSDPNLRVRMNKNHMGYTIIFADLIDPDTNSPFKDMRVRKAVSLAIDRKNICERIMLGTAEPLGDIISPFTLGFDKTLQPDPYDPEKARALLKEAGYPEGITVEMPVMQLYKSIGEVLAVNLNEAGIKAKMNLYEVGAFYQAWGQKKLRGLIPYAGFAVAERYASSDLASFYQEDSYHCYFSTPEINKALEQANYSETEEEMAAWGRKLSKLIRETFITVNLWQGHLAYGLGPRIKSWTPPKGSDEYFESIVLNE